VSVSRILFSPCMFFSALNSDSSLVCSCIYDFIGDRHFGGVKRQASVMSIAPIAVSVGQAKRGSESFKAHTLSQQFKNLCRGESFAKEQMAKWKHPETGLKRDDLMIIESLAYDVMEYFGYETAHVKTPFDGKCSTVNVCLTEFVSSLLPTNNLIHYLYYSIAIHRSSTGRVCSSQRSCY